MAKITMRALYDAGLLPVDLAVRYAATARQRPSILSQAAMREDSLEREEREARLSERRSSRHTFYASQED